LIHYHFEAIHPFIDGNGRVGRLLISVLLHRWHLLVQPVLYLSAFFERHRRDYYDLLLGVTERGEWHEWIVFFLRGVATEAWDAVERITQLERLANRWQAELAEASAAPSLIRLAERVFEYPILSISEVAHLLGVTYRTARLNVLKLVEFGYLQPATDATYRRSFIARDIMRAIEGIDKPRRDQY
jgi:Fic family protein